MEELRDKGNFENFKKDVGMANIFIGSLIFIEELADKVPSPETCTSGRWLHQGTVKSAVYQG